MTSRVDDADHSMGHDDGLLAEYDWLQSARSETLHSPRPDAPLTNPWNQPVYRVACGRVMQVAIPGLASRMMAERCVQCCAARGYPAGKGSPKNDQAIRALRGWPTTPDVGPQA